jgi:hypothetical protein
MSITIEVPWGNPYDKKEAWNELLAWTIEVFGLPGERVQFYPAPNWMRFTFGNEKDALLFQLKTLGRRVSDDQITIDFIVSKL